MSDKKKVAWATGRAVNCLSCSDAQVITSEPVYEDDERLYEGRRCDWCGGSL